MMNRQVLTIATGKPLFIDMASNLARSFLWWNAGNGIAFQLVTDHKDLVPVDIAGDITIIEIKPGEIGAAFTPKLYLDTLITNGQTLFIDSDCLIYGDLHEVFNKFEGNGVSVAGGYISDGDWFGDIKAICKNFCITRMPKFNGGIYYMEKGNVATGVYATARELLPRYDELGFTRLRGRENDEVLMSLAMQLHQQAPIADDGTILAEFVNFQSGIRSDLLKGVAELYNDPVNVNYQENWHLRSAKPLIVHFLGDHHLNHPYITEVRQLKYIFKNNLSAGLARFLAYPLVTLPFKIKKGLKNRFRFFYRRLFGARKIKKSERIID